MAFRLVALRLKDTTNRLEAHASDRRRVASAHSEAHSMADSRLRHLSGIRFELIQAVRAKIAAGEYDVDGVLDACLDELLTELA